MLASNGGDARLGGCRRRCPVPRHPRSVATHGQGHFSHESVRANRGALPLRRGLRNFQVEPTARSSVERWSVPTTRRIGATATSMAIAIRDGAAAEHGGQRSVMPEPPK